MPELRHPWAGERIALLTRHGKEQVLAPLLASVTGARVELVDDVDTDALGTFTREVPRAGSQLDAARRKAALAVAHSGARFGLGSEGAFTHGPFGLGSQNVELVVFADPESSLEIVGRAVAPGLHQHGVVSTVAELAELARRAGFPDHGLVVRPDGADDPRLRKGLRSWPELERAFEDARRESSTGTVFVENDLRAHQHPTRRAVIAHAGRDLVERLARRCPACHSPGFGPLAPVPGLPCRDCGAPTREALATELACPRCAHRERRPHGAATAEPSCCDHCNP